MVLCAGPPRGFLSPPSLASSSSSSSSSSLSSSSSSSSWGLGGASALSQTTCAGDKLNLDCGENFVKIVRAFFGFNPMSSRDACAFGDQDCGIFTNVLCPEWTSTCQISVDPVTLPSCGLGVKTTYVKIDYECVPAYVMCEDSDPSSRQAYITTPGYPTRPALFSQDAECPLTFHLRPDEQIQLNAIDISLTPKDDFCSISYVEVRHKTASGDWQAVGRWCRHLDPQTLYISPKGIQSVQIHYFLKDNARPKGFLLHSKTTRREVMVKHEANGGDYGGANFDMAKKMAVDKTSALSEGSGSHAPSTKHSDGTVLSSEILIGVVVGGCVLVLVAALAVGAVCYKQKNTPDKRTLVHASSLGSSSFGSPNGSATPSVGYQSSSVNTSSSSLPSWSVALPAINNPVFTEEYNMYLGKRPPTRNSSGRASVMAVGGGGGGGGGAHKRTGSTTDIGRSSEGGDPAIVANKRDLANRATLLTKEEFSRMNLGPLPASTASLELSRRLSLAEIVQDGVSHQHFAPDAIIHPQHYAAPDGSSQHQQYAVPNGSGDSHGGKGGHYGQLQQQQQQRMSNRAPNPPAPSSRRNSYLELPGSSSSSVRRSAPPPPNSATPLQDDIFRALETPLMRDHDVPSSYRNSPAAASRPSIDAAAAAAAVASFEASTLDRTRKKSDRRAMERLEEYYNSIDIGNAAENGGGDAVRGAGGRRGSLAGVGGRGGGGGGAGGGMGVEMQFRNGVDGRVSMSDIGGIVVHM